MSSRVQQDAVYAAEAESLDRYGRRFRDLRQIRAYLDELTSSDWWLERWPTINGVDAQRTRSRKWAGFASNRTQTIYVGYGESSVEGVILHELAHVVAEDDGHGPVFCFTLLMLVRERMGFMAWAELERAMRKRGCLDGSLLERTPEEG